jgi:hypothetical protein
MKLEMCMSREWKAGSVEQEEGEEGNMPQNMMKKPDAKKREGREVQMHTKTERKSRKRS